MKDWLEKSAKAWTLAEAVITGITFVLVILVFIGRAIYLAWN